MKTRMAAPLMCMAIAALPTCLHTQAGREKTTMQTAHQWKPTTDVRTDAVMVYGSDDRPGLSFAERVQSWRKHGYTAHYMTGIAWGDYQDYFGGAWDGRRHYDEGQQAQQGDTIWHGPSVPYIVPTAQYMDYFKQRHVKPAIDQGIDAIFLEEPEFWARAGYSEAFKREWTDYYGFAWRPQHLSAENNYLANKLKYHLYYRALDDAFTYAKAYGRERGMHVRCYVPTHSLINYALWQIVSPEAALASMASCDGYIAQVWTGTARTPNYYNGVLRERVFETAFLEYGCMESMTRPTGRKTFFLTDPIEDSAKDWDDYRRNYQATFAAQLLYPNTADYEVMPWPDRIYEGLYRTNGTAGEPTTIPQSYATQMQVMVSALASMPLSCNKVSGPQGVSVLMANSMMFQRSPQPIEGYDDPQLSNFLGLALPLLKRGIPVGVTHIENTGYEASLHDVRVLLMSYSNMKPLSPQPHHDLAQWVKHGGTLIYSGRDDDAYQRVREWWNTDTCHFDAPSEHLFQLMDMPRKATDGVYAYGKGRIYVVRRDPKEYVMSHGAHQMLMDVVAKAYGALPQANHLRLDRGPYTIVAVMDESDAGDAPYTLNGQYIDLFQPTLPIVDNPTVAPGQQALLLDLARVGHKRRPQTLAAASRQSDEVATKHSYEFTAKSPTGTTNAMRLLLPRKPKAVSIDGMDAKDSCTYDHGSHTLLLRFKNKAEGVRVRVDF